MTGQSWAAFRAARDRYKKLTEGIAAALPDLGAVLQTLVDSREGPSYTVDTPVVYNRALDEVTASSGITMILVADNPGRREQAAENRRYLVGPSGKIAETFFRSNPELGVDFRTNVLILNKTPIHTPRTAELKELCRLGGTALRDAVEASQRAMAELLVEFWTALGKGAARTDRGASGPASAWRGSGLPVWITGYSEMKRGGIFAAYTERLTALCAENSAFQESLFFYRHFSMNQFTIDLKRQTRPGEPLPAALRRIGTAYRGRVLGTD